MLHLLVSRVRSGYFLSRLWHAARAMTRLAYACDPAGQSSPLQPSLPSPPCPRRRGGRPLQARGPGRRAVASVSLAGRWRWHQRRLRLCLGTGRRPDGRRVRPCCQAERRAASPRLRCPRTTAPRTQLIARRRRKCWQRRRRPVCKSEFVPCSGLILRARWLCSVVLLPVLIG